MLKNITLGQYFPGDSPLHKGDPRAKLVVSLALIVLIFVVKTWIGYAAIFGLLVAGSVVSRIPLKFIWKGIKPIWFILVFTFILNIFFYGEGEVLWSWWKLTITWDGLFRAIKIAVRLVLLLYSTTLLTLCTSPMELTNAMERLMKPLKVIRFPVHELSLMMSIALRFIPTLMEETDRIMKAQTARGASFDTGGLLHRAKGLVPILVPLFVSAFKRADELAMAMESRCYNGGEGRTQMRVMHLAARDYILFAIVALLIVAVCFGI